MEKILTKRRRRWLEASKSRKKNAIFSIQSIKKLAQKSNYDYEQDEVWELIYELLEAVTELVFSFSKGESSAEKLKRLLEFDALHINAIRVTDPELYELIKNNPSYSQIKNIVEKDSEVTTEFLKKKAEKDFENLEIIYKQLRESKSIIGDEIEALTKAMERITIIKNKS